VRIGLTEIVVDDQDKARTFYTEVLGLEVKTDAPYSDTARWLTVQPSSSRRWRTRRACGTAGVLGRTRFDDRCTDHRCANAVERAAQRAVCGGVQISMGATSSR
jgi:catechol 2,3-dioxygenase-like lactoylglutathione lyase family enzyme